MNRRDVELRRRVRAELDWEPELAAQEIGLAVKDGVVTLAGLVDNTELRRVAENAAKRVSGVYVVVEELHVRCSDPRDATDTEIGHAVRQQLKEIHKSSQDSIKARVENGWITLEGEVDVPQHRVNLEECLRQTQGVKGITNRIAVCSGQSLDSSASRAGQVDSSR